MHTIVKMQYVIQSKRNIEIVNNYDKNKDFPSFV
jgi:hypothetical protein